MNIDPDIAAVLEGNSLLQVLKITKGAPGEVPETTNYVVVGTSEKAKAQAALDARVKNEAQLVTTKTSLARQIADITHELNKQRWLGWQEQLDNPAADSKAIAESVVRMEQQLRFLTDTDDYLTHKLQPPAHLRTLEASLGLAKANSLLALAMVAHSEALTNAQLVAAGVFDESGEGTVALIGARTEALKKLCRAADQQVEVAEVALRTERKRQLTVEAQRTVAGALTHAEIVCNNLSAKIGQ